MAETLWYYKTGEGEFGPLPENQLIEQFSTGQLDADTRVRADGETAWRLASGTDPFGESFSVSRRVRRIPLKGGTSAAVTPPPGAMMVPMTSLPPLSPSAPPPARAREEKTNKTTIALYAMIALLTGIVVSGLVWQWIQPPPPWPDHEKVASEAGKPVLIYFYADWCGVCREFAKDVLRSEEFAHQAEAFELLAVNMTDPDGDTAAMADHYRVRGLPTVVFLDRTGRERLFTRMVGAESREAFLVRMGKAQKQ